LRKRQARKGQHKGRYFMGCSRYPSCDGLRNLDASERDAESEAPPIKSRRRRH
jgi:ssDNA-binding Zn-finger/Zn-ribbon topoisomerase 1